MARSLERPPLVLRLHRGLLSRPPDPRQYDLIVAGPTSPTYRGGRPVESPGTLDAGGPLDAYLWMTMEPPAMACGLAESMSVEPPMLLS